MFKLVELRLPGGHRIAVNPEFVAMVEETTDGDKLIIHFQRHCDYPLRATVVGTFDDVVQTLTTGL